MQKKPQPKPLFSTIKLLIEEQEKNERSKMRPPHDMTPHEQHELEGISERNPRLFHKIHGWD